MDTRFYQNICSSESGLYTPIEIKEIDFKKAILSMSGWVQEEKMSGGKQSNSDPLNGRYSHPNFPGKGVYFKSEKNPAKLLCEYAASILSREVLNPEQKEQFAEVHLSLKPGAEYREDKEGLPDAKDIMVGSIAFEDCDELWKDNYRAYNEHDFFAPLKAIFGFVSIPENRPNFAGTFNQHPLQDVVASGRYENLDMFMATALFLEDPDIHYGNILVRPKDIEKMKEDVAQQVAERMQVEFLDAIKIETKIIDGTISAEKKDELYKTVESRIYKEEIKKYKYSVVTRLEAKRIDLAAALENFDDKLHYDEPFRYLPTRKFHLHGGFEPTQHIEEYPRVNRNSKEFAEQFADYSKVPEERVRQGIDKIIKTFARIANIKLLKDFAQRIGDASIKNVNDRGQVLNQLNEYLFKKFRARQESSRRLAFELKLSLCFKRKNPNNERAGFYLAQKESTEHYDILSIISEYPDFFPDIGFVKFKNDGHEDYQDELTEITEKVAIDYFVLDGIFKKPNLLRVVSSDTFSISSIDKNILSELEIATNQLALLKKEMGENKIPSLTERITEYYLKQSQNLKNLMRSNVTFKDVNNFCHDVKRAAEAVKKLRKSLQSATSTQYGVFESVYNKSGKYKKNWHAFWCFPSKKQNPFYKCLSVIKGIVTLEIPLNFLKIFSELIPAVGKYVFRKIFNSCLNYIRNPNNSILKRALVLLIPGSICGTGEVLFSIVHYVGKRITSPITSFTDAYDSGYKFGVEREWSETVCKCLGVANAVFSGLVSVVATAAFAALLSPLAVIVAAKTGVVGGYLTYVVNFIKDLPVISVIGRTLGTAFNFMASGLSKVVGSLGLNTLSGYAGVAINKCVAKTASSVSVVFSVITGLFAVLKEGFKKCVSSFKNQKKPVKNQKQYFPQEVKSIDGLSKQGIAKRFLPGKAFSDSRMDSVAKNQYSFHHRSRSQVSEIETKLPEQTPLLAEPHQSDAALSIPDHKIVTKHSRF